MAGAATLVACAGFLFAAQQLPRRDTATLLNPVESAAAPRFAVEIRQPAGPPRVFTGQTNFHGEAVSVSCGTCHATTTPNPLLNAAESLTQFHQGMQFAHGGIACLSCHNPSDYDTLRLANGTELAFQNVMNLCGQCHGPQFRDYRNGSHGGMNGHWDLTSGPRSRNNCVDCHDPHAPQFPQVMPVFKPLPAGRNVHPPKH